MLQVKGTPYVNYWCPQVPNFSPFCFIAYHFRVRCQFETSIQKDPKMTANATICQRYPNICKQCLEVTNFTSFHSTTNHFLARDHFEISAPITKWPKVTLNTTMSKVAKHIMHSMHICVTSINESQMSVRFTLWLAIFVMTWTSWSCQKSQMYRMTSEWPWTFSSRNHPVHTKYRKGTNFCLVCFTPSQFEKRFLKITNAPKASDWHWTLNGQKYSSCVH